MTTQLMTDFSVLRHHFPALSMKVNGKHLTFFDNPGGTQVPQAVIDAMTGYLAYRNANTHGAFPTSLRTDATIEAAREAMADLLNAASPREIIYGPNMTTLTFALSRALGRTWQPGDEIIVTNLDHDANIAPWVALEERGLVIRRCDIHLEDCTLDMEQMQRLINAKTRLVAVGYASNAVGTINDVARIAGWARAAGALTFIDAVQYAPHGPIDVQSLGCDFLACSAYKFFGPHQGVLYGRLDLLASLPAYKVRPASDQAPDKFETGTKSHEAMTGTTAAVDYLAAIGRTFGADYEAGYAEFRERRLYLKSGLAAIAAYERQLGAHLIAGLHRIPGLRIYGITDPSQFDRRVPTVSFTLHGHTSREIARHLGEVNICTWDGNYYALALAERLGLAEQGMLRVGLAHYNTVDEIDQLLAELEQMSKV